MSIANIISLQKLSQKTEKEILALHGVGPSTVPILRDVLKAAGMSILSKK
ncbi:MAG: hypothetical protein WC756_09090 [Taibaiella sp.]